MLMLDGEPGQPPLPEPTKGISFHVDIMKKMDGLLGEMIAGDDITKLFEVSLPSERLAGLGEAALVRLRWWEKRQQKRKGYNAKGEVMTDNLYRHMQELRVAPLDDMLTKHQHLEKEYMPVLKALKDKWEAVNEQGMVGETRGENDTVYLREIYDRCNHTTMGAERTFAVSKERREAMGGGAAHDREAAAVQLALNEPFKIVDAMLPEERAVMMELPFKKQVKARLGQWGKLTETKVRASTMRRALRAQDEETEKAAQEFANAKVLWECEVCTVEDMEKEIEELKFKTKQKVFMDEQLFIMTTGWGNQDLKFKHKNNGEACAVCDCKASDRMVHLKAHMLRVRVRAEERGGKPRSAPYPNIFLRQLPPVHSANPTSAEDNPIFKYKALQEKRAVELCEKEKVKSTLVRLVDLEAEPVPEMDDGLVGRKIQYMWEIEISGKTKLHVYDGVVESVTKHALVPSAPAKKVAARGRKRKGRGGKKAGRGTKRKAVALEGEEEEEEERGKYLPAGTSNDASDIRLMPLTGSKKRFSAPNGHQNGAG
jgi:hypothetical protein